jgi:hypothetical protein
LLLSTCMHHNGPSNTAETKLRNGRTFKERRNVAVSLSY